MVNHTTSQPFRIGISTKTIRSPSIVIPFLLIFTLLDNNGIYKQNKNGATSFKVYDVVQQPKTVQQTSVPLLLWRRGKKTRHIE